MITKSLTRALLPLVFLSLFFTQCSKDDNTVQEPPKPTTRIQLVTLETEGTGILLLNQAYGFVYMDDKNELEGVAALNQDGSINKVFVFLYDAAGKPESMTEVAADLTTILRTFDFTYQGNELVKFGNSNLRYEGNRLVQVDSTRSAYDQNGNVEKTYRIRTGQPEILLSENIYNTSLKSPFFQLLPRKELQASIPVIIPTMSIIETMNNHAFASSKVYAPSGAVNDIQYTYTGSTNGFISQFVRTLSIPGNTRRMSITYEPIP